MLNVSSYLQRAKDMVLDLITEKEIEVIVLIGLKFQNVKYY